MKSQPDKNSFITITNTYHGQRSSIKTKIHTKKQVLLMLQSLALVQKRNQSALTTCMNISTQWKITMKILILLIQKKNTYKILSLNKNNSMKTQMKTWSLKNNKNIFTQTLTTIFHLQQWTKVSWKLIMLIQKTSLMIQKIFQIPQLNPKWTRGKQT